MKHQVLLRCIRDSPSLHTSPRRKMSSPGPK